MSFVSNNVIFFYSRLFLFKKINIILDYSNYLLWCRLALLAFKTYKLQSFINVPPPQFTKDTTNITKENLDFVPFDQQDNLLLANVCNDSKISGIEKYRFRISFLYVDLVTIKLKYL